jgi:hypothetical protein
MKALEATTRISQLHTSVAIHTPKVKKLNIVSVWTDPSVIAIVTTASILVHLVLLGAPGRNLHAHK